MDEEKNIGKGGKDRFYRRKTSKSPINIRGKIRQLEEQMEKHQRHKESPKGVAVPTRQLSPKKLNQTYQNIHQTQELHPSQRITPQNEKRNQISKSPKILQGANAYTRIMDLPPNKKGSHHNRLMMSPGSGNIFRIQSDSTGRKVQRIPISPVSPTQNSQDDLRQLKRQNRRFKDVYSRSLQKLQQLQNKLQQIRNQHAQQRNNWHHNYEVLQSRIDKKGTPLVHIYSYENQNGKILLVNDKIITETDNQNSSCHVQYSKVKNPQPVFSGLSIYSHKDNEE